MFIDGSDGYNTITHFVLQVAQLVGDDRPLAAHALFETRRRVPSLGLDPYLAVAIARRELERDLRLREVQDRVCKGADGTRPEQVAKLAVYDNNSMEAICCDALQPRGMCRGTGLPCRYMQNASS